MTLLAGLPRRAAGFAHSGGGAAPRHYVRLSQKNHAIDLAMYPLGSMPP